ncbi:hypothetical protein EJC49_19570 [Aquibium carbonis]|uniref:Uncharacterized protein n=1 Tax=Aquibium carbonis TaxID=2495581 RepID=A0A429YTB9_9HYPH|nr:hypothetical protein [Aquibium carbonis]RST84688.1 hypothetical protein EJC49_19570 [Aquibium carbonis]
MDFLDAYIIRARLFPAILAISPFIALIAVTVSWDTLSLPQVITTVAVGVLFFAFADLARRMGKRTEKNIFKATGGIPSNTLLMRSDKTFDPTTQERYRKFVSELIGERAPTAKQEAQDPAAARAYYIRADNWLRENTRDHGQFKLLFEENVTYGFRRNLYGIKWAALALNLAVLMACGVILYLDKFSADTLKQVAMIGAFAAVHALYFFFVVTLRSVVAASDQYARQLILSSETLAKKPVMSKEKS